MRPDPELFSDARKLLEHPAISSLLAEQSTEMLYLQDETGRMISVSPSVETLTGYPPHEYMVCAPDLLDLNSHRTREALSRWAHAKTAEIGVPLGPYLVDITHRDGRRRTHSVQERWVEVGGERLLAGIARDVTDLVFSERAYRHVLGSAGLVNYYGEYTREGPKLVFLSEGFRELYNVPPEKAKEDPRHFMDSVHPDDREQLSEAASRVWRGDADPRWSVRFRVVHDDGSVRWVHSRGAVEYNVDGRPHHYMGISEDITEQVQEEERRRQADARLANSQKLEAVGQLAAGVAHSYSNLLLTIQSYLELARNTLDPVHPAVEALDRIQDSADQARGISSSLLSFSKQQTPALQVIDLSMCVEHAARLLQRSIPPRIRIARHIEPGVSVQADHATLTQVVLNLAINARDAIPDTGEIGLRLERDGDLARLSVTDDGHGMDADTLRQAFEPFFTTKPDGAGTGLGLSVSRGIVVGLGGTIEATSEPGRGARFDITIPICDAAQREDIAVRLEGEHAAVILHTPGLACRVIQSTLRSLGYTPAEVDSPEGLLATVEGGAPELMVLEDIACGGVPDLLGRLAERAPSSRIVLITSCEGGSGEVSLPPGAVEVPRPYTMADLSGAVTGDPV